MTPQEFALKVNAELKNDMVDADVKFAKDFVKELKKLGWKNEKMHSSCAVALYETKLKKDNVKLDIVVSRFKGEFVQVDVYGA